ncbi:MAG: hypothetical protein ABI369_13230 [Acetobacteraceae bacterium]
MSKLKVLVALLLLAGCAAPAAQPPGPTTSGSAPGITPGYPH